MLVKYGGKSRQKLVSNNEQVSPSSYAAFIFQRAKGNLNTGAPTSIKIKFRQHTVINLYFIIKYFSYTWKFLTKTLIIFFFFQINKSFFLLLRIHP